MIIDRIRLTTSKITTNKKLEDEKEEYHNNKYVKKRTKYL